MAMATADSECPKDEKVKIITEVYRPFLIEVLDTRDIILHMTGHFDKKDESSETFSILQELCQSQASRCEVTESFLDLLDKKKDQRGLFQGFMRALEESNNGYVKKHLEGTFDFNTKRRAQYQYFLNIYAPELQNMAPKDILPHLDECLTPRDKEAIISKIEREGNMAGASELIMRLDRKSNWFEALIVGLQRTGTDRLAKDLNEKRNFVLGLSEEEDMDTTDGDSTTIAEDTATCYVDNKTNAMNDDDDGGPVELVLRPYQEKVVRPALRGENSMVVMPTGTGKTEVAIAVIQHRYLPSMEHQQGASNCQKPKVVFVVNKVPLVKQQKDRCLKYLMNRCLVAGVSGEELTQVPLHSVIQEHDIVVLTAQILVNALKDGESHFKLSDIALLILDECHHCQKSNPYNILMAMYRDMKLSNSSVKRPQILGLTASPGVGDSKNSLQAKDHIKKLCANLDCSISHSPGPSSKPSDKPKEIQIIVKGRPIDDPYYREIDSLMASIEKKISDSEDGRKLLREVPELMKLSSQRGQQSYEQTVVQLTKMIQERVEDEESLKELIACANFLREYNNSLYVNRDARTKDAIKYMEEYIDEQKLSNVSGAMDLLLINMFKEKLPQLRQISELHVSDNPVLEELGKHLKKEYQQKPDSLAIIFTKTRESAKALVKWLNEDISLKKLNADFLIGGGGQGMTSSAQETLLQMFRDQQCQVIVATSVAEEGLDIQKCNLVFRYNYVTSDIGHVQTKGRSRAFQGKIYVIVNGDLQLQERELRNIIRVKMMEEAVRHIAAMDPLVLSNEIMVKQKEDQKERRNAEQSVNAKRAKRVAMSDVKFHCGKCFEIACSSDDIRSINDQHHIVHNDLFLDKIELANLKKPLFIDQLEYRKEILCKKCQKKWGTMVVYKGNELPLIAVKNFTLKTSEGKKLLLKKWKDVPFLVMKVDVEDLLKPTNNQADEGEGEEEINEIDEDDTLLDFSNITQPD